MTRYFFYFHLPHYPTVFITKVGDNREDQARLRMMQKLSLDEDVQTFLFEPRTEVYDHWCEVDPRVRDRVRYVNFIDLWRFHFSPLHRSDWDWLLHRSA